MDLESGELLQHIIEVIVAPRDRRVRQPLLRERLLAELVGTSFIALAVGVTAVSGNSLAPVAVGLVVAVQVYNFGAVSGGFFNPAVVVAVFLSGRGKVSLPHSAAYVGAQLLGAVAGGLGAFAGTGSTFCFDFADGRGWGASLEFEVLLTMALCITVLSVGTSNDAPNQYFGFAIGLSVTAGALVSGTFSPASLNPALTVGMNLANYANSNATHHPSVGDWALFLILPLIGGALAAVVFCATRGNEYAELMRKPPKHATTDSSRLGHAGPSQKGTDEEGFQSL